MSVKRSLLLSALIGLVTGYLCFIARSVFFPGPGDFNWALETAWALLNDNDPYDFAPSALRIPYPLPVALFGLPLLPLEPRLAGASFFGISSAVLAYGVLRSDAPWRLIVFCSFPYLYALCFAQWSTLIMAAWFFPILGPLLVLVKPQIALPVALVRLSRPGVVLAGAVLMLSLAIYPTWPFRWLSMLRSFESIVPLLTLPFGPLLLAALIYYKEPRAQLLLAMALLPFRGVYDLLALWLLPTTRLQMLLLTLLSWVVPIISFGAGVMVRPAWAVPVLFVPALICVLLSYRQQAATPQGVKATVPTTSGTD